ncbi:MAG TPA: hypothetical protein VFC74_02185 [Oscillospiraceae bacterium]|nr:hypothetical protein [Oscillospiraceae bacterium]
MATGKSTNFFAGTNSYQGFKSLFHYIADERTKRLVILKGGPGTGKSTIMKQVMQKALDAGYDTENFFCSSDHASLDAVSIPDLGYVIVDGTAPHIVEPIIPGAYDEILNLGDFWDASALQPYKKEINDFMQENSNYYKQAYQYLKEAAVVMEKLRWLMAQAMDYQAVDAMTHQLLTELAAALPASTRAAKERHLFGSSITPAGLVNFYPSILQNTERFYLLSGDPGCGKSYLLEQIRQTVNRAGHDTEVYRCGFDPDHIDAVVIPVLKTAFVKITYPHTFSVNPVQVVKEQATIALSRYANTTILKKYSGERSESSERLWFLLGKAVEMIRGSKRNHDQLENYYIKAMDYSRLDAVRQQLSARILKQEAKDK